jgi:hypothetical protein
MITSSVATCPRQALTSDRTCLTCHWPVLDGQGVAHPHLRSIAHQGACNTTISDLLRIRDRSPRGRLRPDSQVRDLANGALCPVCPAVPR